MVEQSPIASFMTCFICSPSSPAVLPIAALLTLSLPVFAGKKYRPKSCFSGGTAKTGLSHRRNIQKPSASVGCFQQGKDGGRFFRPPSFDRDVRPLGRCCGTGKHPCVRYRYEKGCQPAAFFIGTIIYRRPAAAPPAAHSAGEHPDKLSGCRRNPLPACCRCGCCGPSPSPR